MVAPFAMDVKVSMHAKLRDESRHHAEKAALIEIFHPDQLMKTVHAVWRPGAARLHNKIALGCLELHAENLREHGSFRLFFLVASRQKQCCHENGSDAHPQLGYTGRQPCKEK